MDAFAVPRQHTSYPARSGRVTSQGGRRGCIKAGFPLFPQLLGNLAKAARFPHSHSSADEAVEKWKTKSRFPTFPPPSVGSNKQTKTADCVGEEKGDTSIEVSNHKCYPAETCAA